MSLVKYNLSNDNSLLDITGEDFNIENLKELLNILKEINKKKTLTKVIVSGNFNTQLVLEDFFSKNNEIKKILILFQLITKTIEDSHINFVSNISNIAQGPALEIALSCKKIIANNKTIFKFEEVDNGLMPFFGSIQRLLRLIGYKNVLDTLLNKKYIDYESAKSFKVVNTNISDIIKVNQKKNFWDQSFTNTFIFYNSKIHSKTKNKLPAYNAVLSCIFEGAVCGYEAALSIERKWLQWLLNQENTIKKLN